METQALIRIAVLCLLATAPAPAQTADMQKILERLDRLEEQNKALAAQVQSLRDELAAAPQPSTEERLQVQESRTAELASAKVEASQRFPIRLTGMLLFNSFLNSSGSGAQEYPTVAQPGATRSGGATLRQTILGFDYSGPRILGDGKLSASVRMDFWEGSNTPAGQEIRMRTGTVSVDWKDRSILVGVDKPLISPREPESLAQVWLSPLTAAGNLWLWIPQARFEQDFHFTRETGLKAQVGVVGTREVAASPASPYAAGASPDAYIEPTRPGIEGRVELFTGGEDRRFEIASGFHHSVSHVLGDSLSSDVLSFDLLARPWRPIEFSGAFFTGQNVAPLGTTGIRQGFVALGPGLVSIGHSIGGWGQLTLRPASRLWFNLFSGQQDDRNPQLTTGAVGKNLAYGANVFYRLAPNVLASFEASQVRTNYIGSGVLLNNHYDLALAYLF